MKNLMTFLLLLLWHSKMEDKTPGSQHFPGKPTYYLHEEVLFYGYIPALH